MSKIIPINAVRTTDQWLIDRGFQKLRKGHKEFLFKKDELYIEHYEGSEVAEGTWYRVCPMADGTQYYSGTGTIGYNCNYTYLIEQHYFNIHDRKL